VHYGALRRRFEALTPEAREVYTKARDTYRLHMRDVRSAIKGRIERAGMSSDRKAAMLKRMDDEFFGHTKGVYFPLARFGQYVVVVKDAEGKTASVSRAETMAEADAMRGQMVSAFPKEKGFSVGKVLKAKDFVAERDTVGRGRPRRCASSLLACGRGSLTKHWRIISPLASVPAKYGSCSRMRLTSCKCLG
jgi:hypothetical protein